MKKLVFSIIVVTLMSGCQYEDTKFEFLCIDGVRYIEYSTFYQYSLTAKFNPDGTVETCGDSR